MPQVDGEDDDSALTHDPREYFMERAEPLTPESLPYVTKKSFEDGLAELHTCCMNREGRFEEVAEGLWAFDPATKSWYSLGGKSERTSE